MYIVNRVIMTLVSLFIFAFGTITFLLLSGIVVPHNSYLRNILGLYSAWQSVALIKGVNPNVAIIIAVILGIIGLLLLILELWPIGRLFRQPKATHFVVHSDPLGEVTVAHSMVRDLVQHEVAAVAGVTQVVDVPRVVDGPHGLRVSTRAALSLDANAPGVGQTLQERIKESIQSHLGLPVAEVTVATEAAPPPKPSGRRVV
ncbi:MAG: alkaline shock response membrane anchor protein AmaP [Ktedonobacterales bacterium]